MEDILQLNDQTYIRASSKLADPRVRVLKYGEVFGIFDVFGDIKPFGLGTQGLYSGATRFLSRMELRMGSHYPVFLSSTITNDDMLLTADLSNPVIVHPNGQKLKHSTFHIFRSKFLTEDSCYEELQITNFCNNACHLPLGFLFNADFMDMFEIRGIERKKRGVILPIEYNENSVIFTYKGLDNLTRKCRIYFHPTPMEITEKECKFIIAVPPKQQVKVFVTVNCFEGEIPDRLPELFTDVFPRFVPAYKEQITSGCQVQASSERFNSWLERSKADIALMTTKTSLGASYPYAGIPWFNTIFGRDGIITAMQYLWIDPNLARGVLNCLVKLQAQEDNPHEDAEPGKILHEFRKGEMVDTGEIPFKRYYGSVDSTPLFIILAGYYLEVTADKEFIESIWPSIQAALTWIDKYGDLDGDGFIEYQKRSESGLKNQGWKDSFDSISHVGGVLAEGPIALAEVQSYVYEAKIQAAKMAKRLGALDFSSKLLLDAEAFKTKFLAKFWDANLDCLVMALDGKKNSCNVLSSNAGHCLFSGIVNQEQAEKIAQKMLSEEMFSGWGIRTLSTKESRYNPMSYHNGSIWPHDNSLIAEGFARYSLKEEVLQVTEAFFDVSVAVDLYRVPELFCGFPRRQSQGPTLYPVACSPQAWAAASVFLFLKACLGLSIDGFENRLTFHHPVLPWFINELWLKNLQVNEASVDILFRRHGQEVSVYVEKRTGKVDVNVLK